MKKVWVLMTNDYPNSVHETEELARDEALRLGQAEQARREGDGGYLGRMWLRYHVHAVPFHTPAVAPVPAHPRAAAGGVK